MKVIFSQPFEQRNVLGIALVFTNPRSFRLGKGVKACYARAGPNRPLRKLTRRRTFGASCQLHELRKRVTALWEFGIRNGVSYCRGQVETDESHDHLVLERMRVPNRFFY